MRIRINTFIARSIDSYKTPLIRPSITEFTARSSVQGSARLPLKSKSALLGLTLLAAGTFGLAGCRSGGTSSAAALPAKVTAPTATQVAYTSAHVGSISQIQPVTGALSAQNDVTVGAKLAGKISFVYFREGDAVRKGQIVVQQDPADLQAQLDQQRANLAAAQTRLVQAKTTVENAKDDTAVDTETDQQCGGGGQSRAGCSETAVRGCQKWGARSGASAGAGQCLAGDRRPRKRPRRSGEFAGGRRTRASRPAALPEAVCAKRHSRPADRPGQSGGRQRNGACERLPGQIELGRRACQKSSSGFPLSARCQGEAPPMVRRSLQTGVSLQSLPASWARHSFFR